jgi:predicted ATPase/DNA-binding winged helix-turn-helix (wHTH) protein
MKDESDGLSILLQRRLVRRGGKIVPIGSRAFSILLALAQRQGDVVSSRELMAECWPNQNVDDANIRIAINTLRKVLDGGGDGGSAIINVPGRGYALVEPAFIEVSDIDHEAPPRGGMLRLDRIIGREQDLDQLATLLKARRLVTITGCGGIGKTTVAMALLEAIGKELSGAVTFVELAPVLDGDRVMTSMATQLGIFAAGDVAQLTAALRTRGGILVLDNCEHVIEVVAELTEAIFRDVPNLLILTTSREPLGIYGEWVYRLSPLALPPPDDDLSSEEIQVFSAVQLFLHRAKNANADFQLSAEEAPLISGICRRLDGLPLAIELAAARVDAYDLPELSRLLDDRFNLLTQGRRTALPRHKTLKAMVDWSHDLLGETERAVFRRLSVFPGLFNLEAAGAVANWGDVNNEEFVATLASLASKSLVVPSRVQDGAAFHLFETMRAYGRQVLEESDEDLETFRRLAVHVLEVLRLRRPGANLPRSLALIEATRAVLSSSLLASADAELVLAVARAALPLFFERALMEECREWSGKIISAMTDTQREGSEAGAVFRYNAMSTLLGWAVLEEVRDALQVALQSAARHQDNHGCRLALDGLFFFCLRKADYKGALSLARDHPIPSEENSGDGWRLGLSLHFAGQHAEAVGALSAALAKLEPGSRLDIVQNGIDRRILARCALSLSLWARGATDAALEEARAVIDEAEALNHPVSMCIALLWASQVFMWAGDLAAASRHVERLVSCGEHFALNPYRRVGLGLRGAVLTMRGRAEEGASLLRASLEASRQAHRMTLPILGGFLAESYAELDLGWNGLAIVESTLAGVRQEQCTVYLPQLLLLKARLIHNADPSRTSEAGRLVGAAIRLARRHQAQAFEQQALEMADELQSGRKIGPVLYGLPRVEAREPEPFREGMRRSLPGSPASAAGSS